MQSEVELLKTKIGSLVSEYVELFTQEYEDFKVGQKVKQNLQATDTGVIKGDHLVERVIAEWPETLDSIFKLRLNDKEMEWFRGKPGIRWFVRKFKIFSLVRKV